MIPMAQFLVIKYSGYLNLLFFGFVPLVSQHLPNDPIRCSPSWAFVCLGQVCQEEGELWQRTFLTPDDCGDCRLWVNFWLHWEMDSKDWFILSWGCISLPKLAYCFSQHCFRQKDINCELTGRLSRKCVGKGAIGIPLFSYL